MSNPRNDVDWQAQAEIFGQVRSDLVHGNEPPRYGQDFEAKALEMFAARAGWMTKAEAAWHIEGHRIVERKQLADARAKVSELKATVARLYAEAATELVGWLRKDIEQASKLPAGKRAGALLACDWMDVAVRKNEAIVVREAAS